MGSGASSFPLSPEAMEALDSLPEGVKNELESMGLQAIHENALSVETKEVLTSTLSETVVNELRGLANPRKPRHPSIQQIQQDTSISVLQRVEASLDAIECHDTELRACVEVLRESAIAQAKAADERLSNGSPRRELDGCPLLVKANIDVANTLSTAGTPALKEWRPPSTAPVIQRLIDAGCIVVAKTNMPEMALGCHAWCKLHGPTLNVFNKNYTAGGSSMGTAVGIAAGYASIGVGSDTAGSLRGPAELAGVVGFRPSKGVLPSEGVVPCDIALDTVGPMASSVKDCALLYSVMSGGVEKYVPANLDASITIACPADWLEGTVNGQLEAIELAISAFEKKGVVVKRQGVDMKSLTEKPEGSKNYSFREQGLHEYVESHKETLTKSADDILNASDSNPVLKDLFFKAAINMQEKVNTDEYKTLKDEHDAYIQEMVYNRVSIFPISSIVKIHMFTTKCSQEDKYRKYFEDNGVEFILTPVVAGIPKKVDLSSCDDFYGADFMKTLTSHMELYKPLKLNDLCFPSIAMPTKARLRDDIEGNPLPAGFLLWGKMWEDKRLLEVALALEEALADL